MDEEIVGDTPWEKEEIPDASSIMRHFAIKTGLDMDDSSRRFPNEAGFVIREGEDGLSFYWDKYTDVRNIFLTIALTHNNRNNFKDYTSFKVFRLPVEFVRSLHNSLKLEHDPNYNGSPAAIGSPNDRSHTLLIATEVSPEDLLEIRADLSDYCRANHSYSYCPFNVKEIKNEVQELRAAGNNTRFHRLDFYEDESNEAGEAIVAK